MVKKEQAPTDSHQSQKKRDIRQVEGQSGRENDVKAARSSTDPESLRPAALSAESVSKFTDDEIFAAITAELNFLDTDGYSIGDAEMDLLVSAALRHSLIQDYVRWVDDPEWKFGYDDALEDLKDFVAWLESEESHMDLPETEMPKEIPPDKEAPREEPKEAPPKESKEAPPNESKEGPPPEESKEATPEESKEAPPKESKEGPPPEEATPEESKEAPPTPKESKEGPPPEEEAPPTPKESKEGPPPEEPKEATPNNSKEAPPQESEESKEAPAEEPKEAPPLDLKEWEAAERERLRKITMRGDQGLRLDSC